MEQSKLRGLINGERWAVLGCGDYAISDHGRVMRTTSRKGASYGKVLAIYKTPKSGFWVKLHGENVNSHRVSDLVAAAFIGPKPIDRELVHLDGDPNNSYWGNLAYQVPDMELGQPRDMSMVGSVHHELTVAGYFGRDANRCVLWSCKCSCGGSSVVLGTNLRSGHTKTCGRCLRNTSDETLLAEWRSRIQNEARLTGSGCWEWTGTIDAHGYGQASLRAKRIKAHRLSYWAFKEKPSRDMVVMHQCDNPICVNPAHLRLGTNSENNRDMVEKGRQARRERHSQARLTWPVVNEIRSMHATGQHTQAAIGAKFGVTGGTVYCIIKGITWKPE